MRREPDPHDRRSKRIVPTERARDEQRRAEAILAEIEARHAARIGADRYAVLKELLGALAMADAPLPR